MQCDLASLAHCLSDSPRAAGEPGRRELALRCAARPAAFDRWARAGGDGGEFSRRAVRRRSFTLSPLDRALQTAQIIAAQLGVPLAIDERLAEHRREETAEQVAARVAAFWYERVTTAPPGLRASRWSATARPSS